MIRVRYAAPGDLEFVSQDGYIPVAVCARKIDAHEVIVAERETVPVGYARIEFLWSKVPCIGLIRVLPDDRRQGVGRAMLGFLQTELGAAGHQFLLSSSQSDEPEPQTWHRHMGFIECGRLESVNAGGIDEVFFRKELGA